MIVNIVKRCGVHRASDILWRQLTSKQLAASPPLHVLWPNNDGAHNDKPGAIAMAIFLGHSGRPCELIQICLVIGYVQTGVGHEQIRQTQKKTNHANS